MAVGGGDGARRPYLRDGQQSLGGATARSTDGTTVAFAYPNGRGGRLEVDRTFTMTRGSGLSRLERLFHVDGTATLAVEPSTTTMPQGGVVRQVQADGSTQFVLPDATVVTITVDATTLAENVTASDDCPVTLLADGTRGLTHADGLTARDGGVAGPDAYRERHEDADGATRWTLSDGTWVRVRGTVVTGGTGTDLLTALRLDDGTLPEHGRPDLLEVLKARTVKGLTNVTTEAVYDNVVDVNEDRQYTFYDADGPVMDSLIADVCDLSIRLEVPFVSGHTPPPAPEDLDGDATWALTEGQIWSDFRSGEASTGGAPSPAASGGVDPLGVGRGVALGNGGNPPAPAWEPARPR